MRIARRGRDRQEKNSARMTCRRCSLRKTDFVEGNRSVKLLENKKTLVDDRSNHKSLRRENCSTCINIYASALFMTRGGRNKMVKKKLSDKSLAEKHTIYTLGIYIILYSII